MKPQNEITQKLLTFEFSISDIDHHIPKILINSLLNNPDIYIIPSDYIDIIFKNIKCDIHNHLNNYKDIIKIVDILSFLINYNYHSSQFLRKYTYNYKRYIDFLTMSDIILSYQDYDREKNLCKIYNLRECSDHLTILTTQNDKNINNINIKNDKTIDYKNLLNENDRYTLENTKINIELAIFKNHMSIRNDINYSNKMARRLSVISRFIHNRYLKKSKICNRHYSSFTELSKESRSSLYILDKFNNKQYFNEIDMSCSHPTILSNIIYNIYNIKSMYRDCVSSKFYENIQKFCIENGYTTFYSFIDKKYLEYSNIKDIKKMVMMSILYGDIYNKGLDHCMNSLYKEEYDIIKKMDKKKLSNDIMKIESSIFTDIKVDMYKFTVHDAIFFISVDNKDKLINELDKRFKKLKIDYSLKFEENIVNYDIKIDKSLEYKVFIFDNVNYKKVYDIHMLDNNISNREISKRTNLSINTVSKYRKYMR